MPDTKMTLDEEDECWFEVKLEEAIQKAIKNFLHEDCDFIFADRYGSWSHRSINILEERGLVSTELLHIDDQCSQLRARPTAKLLRVALQRHCSTCDMWKYLCDDCLDKFTPGLLSVPKGD